MVNSNLVAERDGVLLKVGDRVVSLYQGGAVPAGADEAHVKLLVDRGLLVDGPEAAEPDDVDGPGPIPAKSANKDAWVAYAVSQGASPEDAEAATKDQLIEQYGGQ